MEAPHSRFNALTFACCSASRFRPFVSSILSCSPTPMIPARKVTFPEPNRAALEDSDLDERLEGAQAVQFERAIRIPCAFDAAIGYWTGEPDWGLLVDAICAGSAGILSASEIETWLGACRCGT